MYAGCAFLVSILNDYDDDIDRIYANTQYGYAPMPLRVTPRQFSGFLNGAAGTGKSAVIHALLLLAEKWQRPGSIITTAYTGIAAQNCNGQTLHSLLGWKLDGKRFRQRRTAAERDIFNRVRLIIIDEASMISRSMFGSINESLQILTNRRESLFGGLHVLMCGDWCQLQPTKGIAAFAEPDTVPFANGNGTSAAAQRHAHELAGIHTVSRTKPQATT